LIWRLLVSIEDHDSRLFDPKIRDGTVAALKRTFEASVFAVPGLVGGFIARGARRDSGFSEGIAGTGRFGASDALLAGRVIVFNCRGNGRVGGGSVISLAGGVGGTSSDFPNADAFAVCICSSQTLLSGRARSAYSFSRPASILIIPRRY